MFMYGIYIIYDVCVCMYDVCMYSTDDYQYDCTVTTPGLLVKRPGNKPRANTDVQRLRILVLYCIGYTYVYI